MTQDPNTGFVFRDRRRVDPETGALRSPEEEPARQPAPPSGDPGAAGNAGAGAADAAESAFAADETEKLRAELAERTLDVQRVQADYINYRRRVDRDRPALEGQAVARVLIQLLPVLDDIDRAREHGELEGGFRAVAESLEKVTAGFGLERYGTEGEPFDPTVHEAMTHEYSPDVEGIVCSTVYQPGYRVGGRVLRAARVAVTEAEGGAVPAPVEGALKLDADEPEQQGPADGDRQE